jgi:transcriptional regulator with XRE-family HTH domain
MRVPQVATHPTELGARRHLVVSQRLRERRRALGLTQKQVITRLARLGVTSSNKALSSLEHGSGIDVAKLPELAAALDCTVTWLLGLTEEPTSWEPDQRDEPARAARPAHAARPHAPNRAAPTRGMRAGALSPDPDRTAPLRAHADPAAYAPSLPPVLGPIAAEV